ncbi:hypothetical protein ACFC0M_35960 [Streptomyces sp. NPDC056149]|uniref:hypothetical protein n=1 Tax=Streptomyces sp. NPDC056149 TaxID=3345728 RepID=UPI0035E06EBA
MTPAPTRVPAQKAARRAAPAAPPAVALPPAFEAFYALHCARYLGYALAHAGEPAASRMVGEAMGEVAIRWADIVRRPNPATCAWLLVRTRIRQRSRFPGPAPEGAALRDPDGSGLRQPALEYDAFVLHEVLGYSAAEAAEVMGEEVSRVRYVLAAGHGRARAGSVAGPAAGGAPVAVRGAPCA